MWDSVAERARAIICLAHPDFREDLERQAYENRLIPRGVSFACRKNRLDESDQPSTTSPAADWFSFCEPLRGRL